VGHERIKAHGLPPRGGEEQDRDVGQKRHIRNHEQGIGYLLSTRTIVGIVVAGIVVLG
jgi:hypothetical protein